MDVFVPLELARGLDPLPRARNLDEQALLLDPDGVVQRDKLAGLRARQRRSACAGVRARTLALVPSLSKERRASTSVETRPGMMLRISLPNSTSCAGGQRTERRGAGGTHETVDGEGGLLVEAAALLLGVLEGDVDELGVARLVRRCEH